MPLINKAGGGGSDTSVVTSSAADVLAGKVIVDADGNEVTGTMPNNGAVSQTLDTSTTSYNIPAGYHNGSGKVSIATETKTATPSTSEQTITPSSGKVLSSVTVNAMPTATQATPSITVSSEGFITASATQTAGYVAAGTKSATKQLTVQAAKTVTPTTSNQTAVASGVYTTGAITVGAIPDKYSQVATGTFTPTAKYGTTVTISGLDFKPKRLMVWADISSSITAPDDNLIFAYIDTQIGKYNFQNHDGYLKISSFTKASDDEYTYDYLAITLLSDGFQLVHSGTSASSKLSFYSTSQAYRYVAIG